jgi:hypothetical protein
MGRTDSVLRMLGRLRSSYFPILPTSLSALTIAFFYCGPLHAAGPYAVGTSEIDPPGKCTIESWGSWARNADFIGVTAPACVVQLWRPVELGSEFTREESEGDWTSSLKIKAKTNFVSLAHSPIGVALSGNVNFNLTDGHASTTTLFSTISIRLADLLRLNLKIGGQSTSCATARLRLGVRISKSRCTRVKFLAEVFGQDG